jgi:radical SAM superfamily enzyme YgiQ (UPF0313 family)
MRPLPAVFQPVIPMKILLVYPRYPDTFWSFRNAMKFIGRKASFPPLGLMTVAAMLPESWEKRLVDMNVRPLVDSDLRWADYVFISAMTIQRQSAQVVIDRCRRLGVKTVAGGPLFTACHDDFPVVDHLLLGEGEVTLPLFLADLQGGTPRRMYTANGWAQLRETPLPLWNLVAMKDYAAMNIQYGRGCPFDCEFCDITALFGRKPRSKPRGQLIAELESLYAEGWRGAVFFVDDNFIGDKPKLKREMLPAIIDWMESKEYPFYFYTEASIDLADDPQLMELMVRAGFQEVFIGIETPHAEGSRRERQGAEPEPRPARFRQGASSRPDSRCTAASSSVSTAIRPRSSTCRSASSRRAASSPPWSGCSPPCAAPGSTSAWNRKADC